MFILGVALAIVTLLFLTPMLVFFGSPDNVLPYAQTYTKITAFGFPFLILSAGGGHLVRADGSPKFTMVINLAGADINTILDAVFVFGLHWGMAGAAAATIIGQIIAAMLVIWYLCHTKTVKLTGASFLPKKDVSLRIISLGAAPCFNQLSMMVVQIVLNKTLKHYGALSVYGESIPIAVSGIVIKVSQVMTLLLSAFRRDCSPSSALITERKNISG